VKEKKKLNYQVLVLTGLLLLTGIVSCQDDAETEEKVFLNIEIAALPTKTTYHIGETPDFTGLVVNNVFTNGTREANTYYKIEWTNPLKQGKSTVTITSRDRIATFDLLFDDDLVDTGLPVVYIETEGQHVIDSKADYINATMLIKAEGKVIHRNTLRIRGRGNATWTYPKKPYKLKLDDKADLLGMGSDKDWVLLSNYCDKSLMRNGIALRVSELIGFPWTAKARFVEVVLNGEYLGNYQLAEGVKQDAQRVNIPKDGYLIERDGYYALEPIWFLSLRNYGYSFKNPDTDDLTEAQLNYIREYMIEFESVLDSDIFNDPVNGYAKYIDTESFVLWFLFQQIIANIDTNLYLTKADNGNSKLFMGPVWDFEYSLGIGWYEGPRPRPADFMLWESDYFYYDRLLQDAAFKEKVKAQWRQINIISLTQDILKYFDDTKALLEKSQELNFQRWDILNTRVSYGAIPLGTYEKEVECDRQFFINHINWLKTAIDNL
jgi:hypothetical protein